MLKKQNTHFSTVIRLITAFAHGPTCNRIAEKEARTDTPRPPFVWLPSRSSTAFYNRSALLHYGLKFSNLSDAMSAAESTHCSAISLDPLTNPSTTHVPKDHLHHARFPMSFDRVHAPTCPLRLETTSACRGQARSTISAAFSAAEARFILGFRKRHRTFSGASTPPPSTTAGLSLSHFHSNILCLLTQGEVVFVVPWCVCCAFAVPAIVLLWCCLYFIGSRRVFEMVSDGFQAQKRGSLDPGQGASRKSFGTCDLD